MKIQCSFLFPNKRKMRIKKLLHIVLTIFNIKIFKTLNEVLITILKKETVQQVFILFLNILNKKNQEINL